MAKKSGGKAEKTDYGALSRALQENGPERLYLLWGEEDYLRESFFAEIKEACLSERADEFNDHRFSSENFNVRALSQAMDTMPFLGGRTLVEVRDFDPNAIKEGEAEQLAAVLSDIPDYCTVCLLLPAGLSPDGRLSLVKTLKKRGKAIEFTPQSQTLLADWIRRHFDARGKSISRQNCEKLIFTAGTLMTRLISEIEKIAAGAPGNEITAADIDRLVQRIPEASVFEMTDRLAERNYDAAAALLAELLRSGEHPIMLLALIGGQMRRLYAARIALDEKKGRDFVMTACNLKMPFMADKLLRSASGFSAPQLADAVALCAEYDYRMKSSSEDDEALLKELFLRIAVGETK